MDACCNQRARRHQSFFLLSSVHQQHQHQYRYHHHRGVSTIMASWHHHHHHHHHHQPRRRQQCLILLLCQLLAPLAWFPHCTPTTNMTCRHVHWTASSNRFRNSGLKKFLSLGSWVDLFLPCGLQQPLQPHQRWMKQPNPSPQVVDATKGLVKHESLQTLVARGFGVITILEDQTSNITCAAAKSALNPRTDTSHTQTATGLQHFNLKHNY